MTPKPRILFVDDHEDTRILITALLGAMGYEVVVAGSVSEGVRLAGSERVDLYLLDSKFAGGDSGKELCERIREFDSRTPIIFYSGDHPARLQESLDCDVQGVVMKPGIDELSGAIDRALNAA